MKVSITFYVQFANEGNRTADYEALRENRSHTRPSRSVSIFFSSSPSRSPVTRHYPRRIIADKIYRADGSSMACVSLRVICPTTNLVSRSCIVCVAFWFFLRPHKRYVCIVARRATIARHSPRSCENDELDSSGCTIKRNVRYHRIICRALSRFLII